MIIKITGAAAAPVSREVIMKALVTKAFFGVLDGEFHPRTVQKGEVIEGDLAAVASGEGWAEEVSETATDADSASADAKPVRRSKRGKA